MFNELTNLLNKELDEVETENNVKTIEDFLKYLLDNYEETNSFDKKRQSIVNEFLREIKKGTEGYTSKKRLIKLILDMEIDQLSFVEKLYSLFNYPFPYADGHLSDLYDETLRLFIDEKLYKEPLEDTFEALPYLDDVKQSNYEKYKICFIRFVEHYIKKEKNNFNRYDNFISKLFMKIYFDDSSENDEYLFEENDYAMDMIDIYDRYVDNLPKSSDKRIEFNQFKYVVLLSLLERIFISPNKEKNYFRQIIIKSNESYVVQALLDQINYENIFSYNFLNTFYHNIFLSDNQEQLNMLFINYFKEVLITLQDLMPGFEELDKLDEQNIEDIVKDFKLIIDKYATK